MPAFRGSVLLGPRGQGYVIEPTGDTYCVTIRFRPGGLAAFIPFPLHELADQTVDLELTWGNDVKGWEEQLFNTPTLEQSGDILTRILQSRLAARPNQRAVQAAVRRIDALGGNISMRALADELGWSEKHLERIFAQSVGFPPKYCARIARFRRLSHFVARPHPNRTMGRLAADFGYYDQSHLTREVTTLAGAPPREFFSFWCPTCGGAPLHLQGCPNQQR